jgi:pre-mRNA-splicing factor ATP-dependent RNA helicase DHX15/PRP43
VCVCVCVCTRLYSKEYYTTTMQRETVPEIRRTSLLATVLTLKRLGIDDVLHFDYMDPPEMDRLVDALKACPQRASPSSQGGPCAISHTRSILCTCVHSHAPLSLCA